jgi:hypothetical protein
MPHSLPSSPTPLSSFTAFFKRATLARDGSADVVFQLAQDQVAAILDLNTNDGMALNVTVWGTQLPEDDELASLIDALGGLGAIKRLASGEDEAGED